MYNITLPTRDVVLACKFLKPNGLFIAMGSGPIDAACPSTLVPVYFHPALTGLRYSFAVFQKV